MSDYEELTANDFTERIHIVTEEFPTEENNYEGTMTTTIISYDDRHESTINTNDI